VTKPSALSRQIHSAPFKRWFAQSQVVDQQGEPLIVFHGTDADFTAFSAEASPLYFEDDRGLFFFTSDPHEAGEYARFAAASRTGFRDLSGARSRVIPAYVSLQNPLHVTVEGDLDPADYFDANDFAAQAVDGGHDGIIVEHLDTGVKLVAASDPTKIKSAIGNAGSFDPTTPDIRYARTDPRYLFAGPQSETSDLQLFDKARQLESQHVSPAYIWRETGWLRGVDGKWRYEIDDSQARLKLGIPAWLHEDVDHRVTQEAVVREDGPLFKAVYREGAADALAAFGHTQDDALANLRTHLARREFDGIESVDRMGGSFFELHQLLDHPRLFAAYPRLRDMMVQFDPDLPTSVDGDYLPGEGLRLNPNRSHAQLLDILIHEVQHVVQAAEGFASGGRHSESFSDAVKRGLDLMSDGERRAVNEWAVRNSDKIASEQHTSAMLTYGLMYQSMRRLIDYANRDRPSGVMRLIRGEMSWAWHPMVRDSAVARDFDELDRSWVNLPKRHKMQARNLFLREQCAEAARLLSDVIPANVQKQFRDDSRQLQSILRSLDRAAERARAETAPYRQLKQNEKAATTLRDRHRHNTPYGIYTALAGEVEARNAEARRELSEGDRRALMPERTADVPDDEAIVIFQNGRSSSIEFALPYSAERVRLGDVGNSGASQRASDTPMTQTPEFRRWFGDSKVLDDAGNPRVVYHGTNADFTTFDSGYLSVNSGNEGHYGAGFYLSTEQAEAKHYGDRIMSLYVSLQNPFTHDSPDFEAVAAHFGFHKEPVDLDRRWLADQIRQHDTNAALYADIVIERPDLSYEDQWALFERRGGSYTSGAIDLNDVIDWMDDPLGHRDEIEGSLAVIPDAVITMGYEHEPTLNHLTDNGLRAQAFTQKLIELGYDGVMANSEVVAFYPEQIKSATDNAGTFLPENADIRFSVAAARSATPAKAQERAQALFTKYSDAAQVETALDQALQDSDDALLALLLKYRGHPETRHTANDLFSAFADLYTDSDNPMLAAVAQTAVRQRDALDLRHRLLEAHDGDLAGVQLTTPSGKQGALFLPDATEPGRVRVSYFDERGFFGHLTRDSYEALLNEAWVDGFREETHGLLEQWMTLDSFNEGNEVVSLIAQVNRGQITHQEYLEQVNTIRAGRDLEQAVVVFKKGTRETASVPFRPASAEDGIIPSASNRYSTAQRLDTAQAQHICDHLMQGWAGKPAVHAVDRVSELPMTLQRDIHRKRATLDVRAAFYNNAVYVIAPRLPNRDALEEVLLHEVIGHYGLRSMLGDDFEATLERIYTAIADTPLANRLRSTYFQEQAFNPRNPDHRQLVAEEYMAHLAESGEYRTLTDAQRYDAEVRSGLRGLGFELPLTHTDIQALLAGAEDVVKNGGIAIPTQHTTCFRRAYHGSPHQFDRFSLKALGTGEGAQAYGWGLYFAGNQKIAEWYRNELSDDQDDDPVFIVDGKEVDCGDDIALRTALYQASHQGAEAAYNDALSMMEVLEARGEVIEPITRRSVDAMKSLVGHDVRQAMGHLYEVEIPDDGDLLDWDRPLADQPASVQAALAPIVQDIDDSIALARDVIDRLGDQPEPPPIVGKAWEHIEALQALTSSGENLYWHIQTLVARAFNEPGVYTDPVAETIAAHPEWASLKDLGRGASARGASMYLNTLGIPGLRYLDGLSRADGDGTHNYVIWDDSVVSIQSVNDQKVQADIQAYNDRQVAAGWTPKRIDDLVNRYSLPGTHGATAAMTCLNPADFLAATTRNSQAADKVREQAGDLDWDRLRQEVVPIHLDVTHLGKQDFQIRSFDGQEHMAALARAGVESVPIVLQLRDEQGRGITKSLSTRHGDITLHGQVFEDIDGDGQCPAGATITGTTLMMLSRLNRDTLKSWMHDHGSRDLRYSRVQAPGTTPMQGFRPSDTVDQSCATLAALGASDTALAQCTDETLADLADKAAYLCRQHVADQLSSFDRVASVNSPSRLLSDAWQRTHAAHFDNHITAAIRSNMSPCELAEQYRQELDDHQIPCDAVALQRLSEATHEVPAFLDSPMLQTGVLASRAQRARTAWNHKVAPFDTLSRPTPGDDAHWSVRAKHGVTEGLHHTKDHCPAPSIATWAALALTHQSLRTHDTAMPANSRLAEAVSIGLPIMNALSKHLSSTADAEHAVATDADLLMAHYPFMRDVLDDALAEVRDTPEMHAAFANVAVASDDASYDAVREHLCAGGYEDLLDTPLPSVSVPETQTDTPEPGLR